MVRFSSVLALRLFSCKGSMFPPLSAASKSSFKMRVFWAGLETPQLLSLVACLVEGQKGALKMRVPLLKLLGVALLGLGTASENVSNQSGPLN